jgi:DNA-binding GntR family transcriptional regulator
MEKTSTRFIVDALTRAIVEHRLLPGAKLVEQKLADQFGVSRTLVRQALYQLSQNRLITLSPARGACVAAPSVQEARQVFEVRRMLEAGLVRNLIENATAQDLQALEQHIALERTAVQHGDAHGRTELLGDFHVLMAQRTGNTVLAEALSDLISRGALITLMYQSSSAAVHSHEQHQAIFHAIQQRDTEQAVALMERHLLHVEQALNLEPQCTPPP